MALRKRRRVSNDDVERMLLLRGDDFLGEEHKTNASRSATYELESIGGSFERYIAAAVASRDEQPVFGVCDELQSFLVFNKLYGQSVSIPVRNSPMREECQLISAYHSRQHARRLAADKFLYEPLYGGVTDCGVAPGQPADGEHAFAPRPAVMCKLTQDLMHTAGSDFGWRALMYLNKGADDPWPTGIVALEAWLFKLVDRQYTNAKGERKTTKDGVDEDDVDEVARRIAGVLARTEEVVRRRAAKESDGEDVPSSFEYCAARPVRIEELPASIGAAVAPSRVESMENVAAVDTMVIDGVD